MNTRRLVLATIVFAAAVLLLLYASSPLSAAEVPPVSQSFEQLNYPPVSDPPPPADNPEAVHNPGAGEVEMLGTMWQPQNRKQFKEWYVLGWGSALRLKPGKAPSDEWVHISPAVVTRSNNVWQKVSTVTFCAATSNPTVSKPLAIHLWSENNDRFYMGNVTWSNTTARQCKSVTLSPAVFKYGVNISLLVHFANGTDQVTLQEVWIDYTD